MVLVVDSLWVLTVLTASVRICCRCESVQLQPAVSNGQSSALILADLPRCYRDDGSGDEFYLRKDVNATRCYYSPAIVMREIAEEIRSAHIRNKEQLDAFMKTKSITFSTVDAGELSDRYCNRGKGDSLFTIKNKQEALFLAKLSRVFLEEKYHWGSDRKSACTILGIVGGRKRVVWTDRTYSKYLKTVWFQGDSCLEMDGEAYPRDEEEILIICQFVWKPPIRPSNIQPAPREQKTTQATREEETSSRQFRVLTTSIPVTTEPGRITTEVAQQSTATEAVQDPTATEVVQESTATEAAQESTATEVVHDSTTTEVVQESTAFLTTANNSTEVKTAQQNQTSTTTIHLARATSVAQEKLSIPNIDITQQANTTWNISHRSETASTFPTVVNMDSKEISTPQRDRAEVASHLSTTPFTVSWSTLFPSAATTAYQVFGRTSRGTASTSSAVINITNAHGRRALEETRTKAKQVTEWYENNHTITSTYIDQELTSPSSTEWNGSTNSSIQESFNNNVYSERSYISNMMLSDEIDQRKQKKQHTSTTPSSDETLVMLMLLVGGTVELGSLIVSTLTFTNVIGNP